MKKSLILANSLSLLLCIIFTSGCLRERKMTDDISVLLTTDQEFSDYSVAKGMYAAFDAYMDDSATMYRDGHEPFTGRKAIMALFNPDSPAVLEWSPTSGEIAESGDLGYTLGRWKLTVPDPKGADRVSHGFYVSIWKKQPDGSWKYVFDSGINGPAPEKDVKDN